MLDGGEKKRIKLEDDLVVVAGKNIEVYAFSILLRFEHQPKIRLSSNFFHTPKMERLISLFRTLNVEEMGRESHDNRVVVTLSR